MNAVQNIEYGVYINKQHSKALNTTTRKDKAANRIIIALLVMCIACNRDVDFDGDRNGLLARIVVHPKYLRIIATAAILRILCLSSVCSSNGV